jgi:NADH-quinone oxidoreductase subunit K
MVALFVIILAAAEAAIALAIILNIYRTRTTIDVTRVDEMQL